MFYSQNNSQSLQLYQCARSLARERQTDTEKDRDRETETDGQEDTCILRLSKKTVQRVEFYIDTAVKKTDGSEIATNR